MNKEINVEELLSKNQHPLMQVIVESSKAMTARTDTHIDKPLILSGTTAVWHNASAYGVEQPQILSGTTAICTGNMGNDARRYGCSVGGIGGNVCIIGGQSNQNNNAYSCAQSQGDLMRNYTCMNISRLYE